jgi:hypothetical protein
MICPKCGFQQKDDSECGRCGIVFERFHKKGIGYLPDSPDPFPGAPALSGTRILTTAYRAIRWVSLAVFVLTALLILLPGRPPRVEASPASAMRAEEKVHEFQKSLQAGNALPLEMDEAELNSWLGANLALQHQDPQAGDESSNAAPSDPPENAAAMPLEKPEPTVEEVQSTVRDVKISLLDHSLRAFVAFDFHGKELTLELEGRLLAKDGYLRLEPESGQLGSLPLPAAVLRNAAERLFGDPKHKERFRLPPHIQDLHVLEGNLVIIPQ